MTTLSHPSHPALDHIAGERVYRPAPSWLIVRGLDIEKTRKGILLPGQGKTKGEDGARVPAVGEVMATPHHCTEEWGTYEQVHGPLCDVGDLVLYFPQTFPIVPLHDGLYLVSMDAVYLVVRKGGVARPYELRWVPVEESHPAPPSLVEVP